MPLPNQPLISHKAFRVASDWAITEWQLSTESPYFYQVTETILFGLCSFIFLYENANTRQI